MTSLAFYKYSCQPIYGVVTLTKQVQGQHKHQTLYTPIS